MENKQDRSVEELKLMSVGDLFGLYKELPINDLRDWTDMSDEAKDLMREVSDWVEANLELVRSGQVDVEEAHGYLEDMNRHLKGLSGDGHELFDRGTLAMQGKVWTAEAMYWQSRVKYDLLDDNSEKATCTKNMLIASMKALKLYLACHVMSGTRIEVDGKDDFRQAIIVLLWNCGFTEEAITLLTQDQNRNQ